MNTQRLTKIVLLELGNDQLKLEEELESMINSETDINVKITTIKSLLGRLSVNDASIARFSKMAEQQNNNV